MLGEVEVRKNLAKHVYGEDRQRLALQWLAHQESLRASQASAETVSEARNSNALAREANTLASNANDIALRALTASQANNNIAVAALIAAIVAIAASIIGIFIHR